MKAVSRQNIRLVLILLSTASSFAACAYRHDKEAGLPAPGARDEIRKHVFVDRGMHKSGALTPEQRDQLLSWLDAGAPAQGSASDAPIAGSPAAPAPPAPTWENVQKRFFTPYCARCHSGDSPEGELNVTDLDQVRAKASPILKHVFVLQDMPRSRRAFDSMSTESKSLLVNWIGASMPGPDGALFVPATPAPSAVPGPAAP